MSNSLHNQVEDIQDERLKEKARRLLQQDPRFVRGFVARTDNRGRVGWIPWQQATAQGETGTTDNVLTSKRYNARVAEGFRRKSPIVKRTERERAESLARRFWDTIKDNPAMAPLVLKELHEEYWKAGRPVSYEDVKDAAIELLKKAAAEAARKGRH